MLKLPNLSKSLSFAIVASIFALSMTSCARGTYYKAGEDYAKYPERYYRDDTQTMNDPWMQYTQTNPPATENCQNPKHQKRH